MALLHSAKADLDEFRNIIFADRLRQELIYPCFHGLALESLLRIGSAATNYRRFLLSKLRIFFVNLMDCLSENRSIYLWHTVIKHDELIHAHLFRQL